MCHLFMWFWVWHMYVLYTCVCVCVCARALHMCMCQYGWVAVFIKKWSRSWGCHLWFSSKQLCPACFSACTWQLVHVCMHHSISHWISTCPWIVSIAGSGQVYNEKWNHQINKQMNDSNKIQKNLHLFDINAFKHDLSIYNDQLTHPSIFLFQNSYSSHR